MNYLITKGIGIFGEPTLGSKISNCDYINELFAIVVFRNRCHFVHDLVCRNQLKLVQQPSKIAVQELDRVSG